MIAREAARRMMSALAITGPCQPLARPAVRSPERDVQPGVVLALLGPNGTVRCHTRWERRA